MKQTILGAVALTLIVLACTTRTPVVPCQMLDYQIELHNDTVWIYDNGRYVGQYITDWKQQIDTILLKDNL
jgi:hypothetical protein